MHTDASLNLIYTIPRKEHTGMHTFDVVDTLECTGQIKQHVRSRRILKILCAGGDRLGERDSMRNSVGVESGVSGLIFLAANTYTIISSN